jgi:hypothetical protein
MGRRGTVACAAKLTEIPQTKALALMGNAADALEKEDATINAAKLLRREWLKMI